MSILLRPDAARVVPVWAGGTTVLRIGWVEGRRLLRNPLVVLVTLGNALLFVPRFWGEEVGQSWSTEFFESFPGVGGLPSLMALVVASLTAMRDVDRPTKELLSTSPATTVDRTLGLALAGAVPVLTTVATLAALQLLIVRAGGVTTGEVAPMRLIPSPGFLAVVVLTVATSWMLGIALARTFRSRAFVVAAGGLCAVASQMFWLWLWFPAVFLMPWATPLAQFDLGVSPTYDEIRGAAPVKFPTEWDDHWYRLVLQEDRVLWHDCYLVGALLLLLAYACWRSGADRRTRWIALAGLVLAVAGFVAQVIAWGGDVLWFDEMWSV